MAPDCRVDRRFSRAETGGPMKYVRAALRRLAGLFTGHRADDELREELQAHLDMETAEYVRRGLSLDEARRQALLASGGITQAAEAVRDRRGLPWIENIAADVRYALRTLRRSPAFTAVVVITLALGIGANTAIFSVVRGVLLKPLPNRDGDRLLYLRHSSDGPGQANISFSVPEVSDFRTGVPSLGGIAEYSPWRLTLQGDNEAVRIDVGLVTGNYFEVMGLSPVLGRLTRPSDDGPGVPPVMILTHAFWMKRFGGDSSVVGRQVKLDGRSVTVIGVLQPAPFFPDPIDALLNMVVSPHHVSAMMIQNRSHRMTEVVARLAPGASVAQAQTEVAAVCARMQHDHTDAYNPGSHYRVAVIPFKDALGERARLTLWLLMGAAAFVMIISAANVANLSLMRGVRREHELVVRAALGAGVARLRRLLLAENLLLALAGAGLLTRTMVRLSQVDSGLRAEEVLAIEVPLLQMSGGSTDPSDPAAQYRYILEQDGVAKQRYQRMRDEIRALPGVNEAGLGSSIPLGSSLLTFEVKAEARAVIVGEAVPRTDVRTASPEYFRASGIPLIRGREFTSTDQAGSGLVVIVNKTFADKFFPGEDPIGKRIAWTGPLLKLSPLSGDWRTIVGVIGNTRDGGLDAEPRATVFMPFAQMLAISGALVIRADSNAPGLIAAATRIVHRIAPAAPIVSVLTLAQIKDRSVAPRRLNAALVSSFGILAVIIAAVGIAGVLAFSVSARANEIGIRMSLGADSGRVQRMILWEGGVLLVTGLVLGVVGAFFGAGVIRGLLFGVAPHDPETFVAVAVLMAAIGIVACWIPALRAARIDPAITMRSA